VGRPVSVVYSGMVAGQVIRTWSLPLVNMFPDIMALSIVRSGRPTCSSSWRS